MFNGGGSGISVGDLLSAMGTRNNNGGNGDMFGAAGGIWVLIILFAIFGGWGNRNGNGNGDSSGGGSNVTVVPMPIGGYGCSGGFGGGWGAFDASAMQAGFNNQAVLTKLDGINSGICALGYDQLSQMNNLGMAVQQSGFNTTNQIQNTGFALQQTATQGQIAMMQGFNDAAMQRANCCCEQREAIAQVRYDMATEGCATRNQMTMDTNAIIQNQNQNAQALQKTVQDGFTALAMEAKDQQIAALTAQVNRDGRQADLQAIATYIINQVNPRSEPAYLTCNPNTGNVIPQSGLDQMAINNIRWQNWQNQNCCGNVYNNGTF